VVTSQSQIQSQTAEIPLDTKRNIIAFTGDISFFVIATYFIPVTTVLVGLASELTDNKALIGAVGTSWLAVWYLPQLFAARLVRGQRYQKKYLVISALIGRPVFLLFALWLAITRAEQPLLTVWLLLAAISVFAFTDAIAGVAWFDMMGRAISPRMRGRIITFSQLAATIVGLGISVLTRYLLDPIVLAFPLNYAVILGLAWLAMVASLALFMLFKENPLTEATVQHTSETSLLTSLKTAYASDPVFRRLLLARLLTGIEVMAASFYIVFIKESLKLDDSAIGTFTQVLIVGAMAGLLLFGWLSERFGPRRVIQASTTFQFIGPLLSLVIALLPVLLTQFPDIAFALMVVVLGLRGAVEHSLVLGFVGYAMDHASERNRAVYVGVINTAGGIVALMPVLGGFLLEALMPAGPSVAYSVVFGLTALLVGMGLLLVFRLPKIAN
jgi:MFS family permease